ncbi:MAG: hypothetical protein K9K67_05720 [Bacteriovoracaceae bacterium]|nr:hypothetical protein [Bacteriovoracaceae bacterium]
MKIAVVGSGPVAFEVGLSFHLEGADVRVIGRQSPCSKLEMMANNFGHYSLNPESYISSKGREFVGLEEDPQNFQDLWSNYYVPLIQKMVQAGLFHQRDVLRVQKRFLDTDEHIDSHTRLYDLFRLTYGLNPSGLVEEQIKENPELKEKLGPEMLNSLKNQVESFEDFDLIFDCRGPCQRAIPMGAGNHFALNERSVAELGGVLYGDKGIKELEEVKKQKILTIVGSSIQSALQFLSLKEWLEEEGNILNIISTENSMFQKVLKNELTNESIKSELKNLIHTHLEVWRQACLKTEEAVHEWRQLAPHEKVKISEPQFPEPKLRLFEGYSVTSVDRLIDREGLYLTLEIPEWRDSQKREMVTVSQERVIAAVGYLPDYEFSLGLHPEEPGYFNFSKDIDAWTPKPSLELIPLVKSEVFKYFTKA